MRWSVIVWDLGSYRNPYLFLVRKEEFERIHTIRNGTPYHRKPVENERRLIWILEKKLGKDIEDHSEDKKGGKSGGDQNWC